MIVDWNFFYFLSQSWACQRLGKTLSLMQLLVFEAAQIYIFSPSFTVRGLFLPIDFHYNDIFDCKAMTPYNHDF